MEKVVLTPISVPELVGEIARAVRTELDARPQHVQPIPEEVLTRSQAAALLGITLPTLREYTRKGLVTGYRIGSRVKYKRNEVIDSLQRIRTAKTQR